MKNIKAHLPVLFLLLLSGCLNPPASSPEMIVNSQGQEGENNSSEKTASPSSKNQASSAGFSVHVVCSCGGKALGQKGPSEEEVKARLQALCKTGFSSSLSRCKTQ